MPGIYIHIPFCVKRCSYCNFFSSTDFNYHQSYINALCREMDLRSDYFSNQHADTLYIGGGTPSLLNIDVIEKIISHAKKSFGLKPNAEITLEANPNNLTEDYIRHLSNTSINRLSIGVQSFFDDNLNVLGRIHTGKQAQDSLELADKYSFSNISIDLMYAYPFMTENQWIKNLENAKTVNHLSCYSLSLEPFSVLHKQIENKTYPNLDEDETIAQYEILKNFAKDNNFIHYETSNFCKSGQFSRHNLAYWHDEAYIGLGTSAHSFNHIHRQWNTADINNYISQIMSTNLSEEWETKGKGVIFDQELLTPTMRVNEYIMTSLRTIWGCDMHYVNNKFGKSFYDELIEKIKTINPQLYNLEDDKLILTEKGSLLADAIACELFF